MRTYITRINGWSLRDKSHYMQHMVAEIGHQLGFREMGIYRLFWEEEGWESLSSRLDGIIAGINSGDLIIYQFPTGNGMRFENELMNRIKAYGGRLAIFVHEMEFLADEEKKSQQGAAIGLLNQAEVLIVPTYAIRKWLIDNGIRKSMKFVVQEMWDYTVNESLGNEPMLKRKILFTDREGFAGMNEWNYPVTLTLYNVAAAQGQNVQNLGEREPHQLLSELHEGGFGLIWYKDEYSRSYMEQSNSFSLARYLAAGIPVIVPAGISHQTLIEENHLGLVVNFLGEAAAAVEKITEEEYRDYVKSVEQFAPALRNGYYTKNCLIEAMQAFYRKDAGMLPLPERVYKAGENAFRSVALNESYGGNLAFSWDFRGEADGILIYDTAGELLGNTRDILQHYILLERTEKKNGVIAKAYVETLKGKMILAESEVVYLGKKNYFKPKVSIIIAAYNAEEFIARAIDTVLAQSFADLEAIIVNDGSTDRTQEIVSWYEDRFPQVKSVYQSNSGPAISRNTGVKYASGDYIGYIDSDDMARPNMVGRLYKSITKNNCDIAMAPSYQVTNEGYGEVGAYSLEEDVPIPVETFFEHYVRYAYPVVWNKLYRKSLVAEHPMPKVTYEDSAWMPCILSYAESLCYINEHLYDYDRTLRNTTYVQSASSKSLEEQFKDSREYVMYFLENGNPQKRPLLKRLAWGYAIGFADVFPFPEARKLIEEIGRF
ncbi:MAG: glycosyltransferase [Roseburia sp.]|nr:glycosyltransferase [Roseburia sp.]